ncbi:hypothetical protein [Bacillus muralis]|uniref:hypothetical protein n=1 Tax=Peribacillus muralis TaxID=264697 RepID=UPI0007DB4C0E
MRSKMVLRIGAKLFCEKRGKGCFFMMKQFGMNFASNKSTGFEAAKYRLEQKIMAYYKNFALNVLNFMQNINYFDKNEKLARNLLIK